MPSPFPGMDPYLEGSLWSDLHASLIVSIRLALVRTLPERYTALVGQHVWLEEPDGDRSLIGVPDVHVPAFGPARPGAAAAVLDAPVRTTLPAARRPGPRFVRVTDRDLRRVVTVIELLSPGNKDAGKDRPNYLAKREEYFSAGVNLVEIDLLRAGGRMPLGDPPPAASDYAIFVCREATFPKADVWPFGVRDKIPTLVVPLDPADADARIDLRACVDECYDGAAYRRLLDYARPPVPPLPAADAAWAAGLFPPAGGP